MDTDLVARRDRATMHPIGGREVGWDAIRPVWDQVASLTPGARSASPSSSL